FVLVLIVLVFVIFLVVEVLVIIEVVLVIEVEVVVQILVVGILVGILRVVIIRAPALRAEVIEQSAPPPLVGIRRTMRVRHATVLRHKKLVQYRVGLLTAKRALASRPATASFDRSRSRTVSEVGSLEGSPRSARRPRYTPRRPPASTPVAAPIGCSRRWLCCACS